MTIVEAAKKVLLEANEPIQPKDLVQVIENRGLFEFKAKQPIAVLSSTLRKKPDIFVKTDAGFKLK